MYLYFVVVVDFCNDSFFLSEIAAALCSPCAEMWAEKVDLERPLGFGVPSAFPAASSDDRFADKPKPIPVNESVNFLKIPVVDPVEDEAVVVVVVIVVGL